MLECFVGDSFQLDDLPAHVTAVGRDEHLGLGVGNAIVHRLHRKPAVDHTVRGADLGTRQHGKHQFRHARHVDRDNIALGHPHAPQHIGQLAHFPVDSQVGKGPARAVFALPDERLLVAPPGLLVAVDGIVHDVAFRPGKPLVERLVGIIEDFFPRLEPFQTTGHIRPEILRVFTAPAVEVLPVAEPFPVHVGCNIGILDNGRLGSVDFRFGFRFHIVSSAKGFQAIPESGLTGCGRRGA